MTEVDDLKAENARLRGALAQIALRTIQRDLNRLAHAALGHEPVPETVKQMADTERIWALRKAGG